MKFCGVGAVTLASLWCSSGVSLEDTNGGTYINLLYDLYGPTLAAANLGYVWEGREGCWLFTIASATHSAAGQIQKIGNSVTHFLKLYVLFSCVQFLMCACLFLIGWLWLWL